LSYLIISMECTPEYC